MEKILDVFGLRLCQPLSTPEKRIGATNVVEGRGCCGALVGLLLVSGFSRVDSWSNYQYNWRAY